MIKTANGLLLKILQLKVSRLDKRKVVFLDKEGHSREIQKAQYNERSNTVELVEVGFDPPDSFYR